MRSSPDAAVDEILPAPMPRPRYLLSAPISPPNRGISRNIQHTWCRIKSNILRWQPPTTNSRAQKMILKSQDLKKKKKKKWQGSSYCSSRGSQNRISRKVSAVFVPTIAGPTFRFRFRRLMHVYSGLSAPRLDTCFGIASPDLCGW